MANATINPYQIDVSRSAARRYLEELGRKGGEKGHNIGDAKEAIRDIMVQAVDQDPQPQGPKRRRPYRVGPLVFVVTDDRDMVVDFYHERPPSPKRLKKMRKDK